jgi:hypothetical protein
MGALLVGGAFVAAVRCLGVRGLTVPANSPVLGPLIACTRIHRKHCVGGGGQDVAALEQLLRQAMSYSDSVAVAVDAGDEALLAEVTEMVTGLSAGPGASAVLVTVVPVSPWGSFVPALNALLLHAARSGAALVLFMSVELQLTPSHVHVLRQHLTEDTLVVGARIPGQDFSPGTHLLTGANSPWNTLAVWAVPKLLEVGFLGVSEGLLDGVPAGVEEGPVVALQQLLHPTTRRCKLVALDPPPRWHTDWEDPGRLAWHRDKMESKVQRTAAQLRAAHLPAPIVEHILGGA